MAIGKLGAADLAANANTTIYNPTGVAGTVTLSLCNRTANGALVRVALAAAAAPTAAEWLEYDYYLGPNAVLERSAIVVGPGQHLVARANAAGVSAVAFGFED
ncbi:hypothetical protein [Acidovorax sp.]|uniref:hypothetical protein n=1 Tax=Acidovorax sp. TaxID=1872122 RepID=UPI002ACE1F3F|nr:hypothetical protein [Acidovorax sp.]MDZ7862462.1 hypothetical protein [Acidovorax sp.]